MGRKYFDRMLKAAIQVPDNLDELVLPESAAVTFGQAEHALTLKDLEGFDPETFTRELADEDGRRVWLIKAIPFTSGDPAVISRRFPADQWKAEELSALAEGGETFTPAAQQKEPNYFHAKILKDKIRKGADGGLYIEGWASTENIDRDDEIVEPGAFEAAIKAYMDNPILLYQHSHFNPIGKIVEMLVDPKKGFWIKAYISAAADVESIRTKILEIILRAFSIGFWPTNGKMIGDIWHWIEFELLEVSVVSVPSNRQALFDLAKALRWGSDLYAPAAADIPRAIIPPAEITRGEIKRLKDSWQELHSGKAPDIDALPEHITVPDPAKARAPEYLKTRAAVEEVKRLIARRELDQARNAAAEVRTLLKGS